jgi:hypothetical protein
VSAAFISRSPGRASIFDRVDEVAPRVAISPPPEPTWQPDGLNALRRTHPKGTHPPRGRDTRSPSTDGRGRLCPRSEGRAAILSAPHMYTFFRCGRRVMEASCALGRPLIRKEF